MKFLALGLAFVVEIAAAFAYGYGGTYFNFALGIILVGLFLIIWSIYLAPKATRRLHQPAYSTLKFILYLGAVVLLAASHRPALAYALAVAMILDEFLLFLSDESRPKAY